MSAYNDIRIAYAEKIERAIDDIVEIVLSDSHVEHTPDEGPPVSAETWLAIKATLLALLAQATEEGAASDAKQYHTTRSPSGLP